MRACSPMFPYFSKIISCLTFQDKPAATTTISAEQQKAQKLSTMKEEANALKMQALAAKKKGDLPTAKTLYKQFKDMNVAIEKLL